MNELLVAAAIPIVGGLSYLLGHDVHKGYRKGCTECGAAQRRAEERQRELQHDYEHRSFGSCRDQACERNTKR